LFQLVLTAIKNYNYFLTLYLCITCLLITSKPYVWYFLFQTVNSQNKPLSLCHSLNGTFGITFNISTWSKWL